jgi:hypothetical protein
MSVDGGSEEVTNGLKSAGRASDKAKMHMLAFWRLLANEGDLHQLPGIVSIVEKYEKKADEIFRKVSTPHLLISCSSHSQ